MNWRGVSPVLSSMVSRYAWNDISTPLPVVLRSVGRARNEIRSFD